jgi:phage-related protein (TIGR01555 family)
LSRRARQRKPGKKAAANTLRLAPRPRKTQNSSVNARSGQGGRQDQGRNYGSARNDSHPLSRSRSTWAQAREWATLYYREWTAQKIVDIPVSDMLRVPWTYKNANDDIAAQLTAGMRRLQFPRALRQSLKLARLLGGSAILLSIRDQNGDAKKPLDLNSVGQGDLIAANVVPRTRISVLEYDYDIFSPTFGRPAIYNVFGQPVHRSRLLIFDGDPLTDNDVHDLGLVSAAHEGFGVSVLAPIWDDIIRATGTRQAAFHLINRASILLILNENMAQMRAVRTGTNALGELDNIADQLSMYHAAMIDGKNIQLDQWSASFGSVPELLQQFLQIISAASDIPATRFLSQAPGGLNATGESDLENYYNMIEAKREEDLRPPLETFLEVLGRSEFGPEFAALKLGIVFPSLWNLSDTEAATVRVQDTGNAVSLYSSGLLTAEESIKELQAREALKVVIDLEDPERITAMESEQDVTGDIASLLDDLDLVDKGDDGDDSLGTTQAAP